MGITIRDVARAAGVSVACASYALNGTGSVSQDKQQRVLQAAKDLGYIPNGMAKSLHAGQNGAVGYFAYSLCGPFFSQILWGIEDAFLDSDLELICCNCCPEQKKIPRFLRERMVDGAIIFCEQLDSTFIEWISGADFPVVVMDRELCSDHISSVLIDNRGGAYAVGKYIHDRGFASVGCITAKGYDGEQRFAGFQQAREAFSLNVLEDWCLPGRFQKEFAHDAVAKRLRQEPRSLPEVLFAFSDDMAIGAMTALQEAGYRIPEDIAVIGMDDIAQGMYTDPSLTSFHRPLYDHGAEAAKTLLRMLKQKQPGSRFILPGHLVERESSKKSKTNF